jgi:hypothetical protein
MYPLKAKEIESWLEQYDDQPKYDNDKHKLSYFIHICRCFVSKGEVNIDFFGNDDIDKDKLPFLNRMITPIVNQLQISLNEENASLYIFKRYKYRTEWHTKDILKDKYHNAANKQYEKVFNDDIRLYLFDQGIDTLSAPDSPSGRVDIVSSTDTETSLVVEIKVFDSEKNYNKDRIISGFAQIVKYTNDYQKNVGYLVVFNLDNVEIEIENKEADNKFPNRVVFNGKTYYIVIINLNFDVSASKQKNLKKISITLDDLSSKN